MLIRHSLLYVLVRVVAGMLGMATTAALTRILDPETYGSYGVALVIMSVGAAMAFEWLGISFMRFYQARSGDPRTLPTFGSLYLLLVLLSGIVGAISCLFLPAALRPLAIAGLLLLWSYSCFELLARVEIVMFQPKRYMWMNAIRGGLTFLGAVMAAWWTRDALWTAIGTSIGMTLGAVVGTSVDFKVFFRPVDRALLRDIFRFGMPLALSSMLSGIMVAGTRGLVGALDSTEALGIYTAAFFLVQNTLMIVSSGLSQASYSLAVKAVESGDLIETRRQLTANGTVLLTVMAPACLGMALTAKGIATALVGARFADGVALVTPWMAAASFFSSVRFHFLDHAFQLGRRPNLLAVVSGVAAVLVLALNLVLIPRDGPVGGAIAVTIAMALSCIHATLSGRKAFPMPLPWLSIGKISVGCLVLAVVVLRVPGTGQTRLVLQMILGAAAYGATVVAFNIMDIHDSIARLCRKKPRIAH